MIIIFYMYLVTPCFVPQPFARGSFDRGRGFDRAVGRFHPPISAIYSIDVSLQVQGKGYRAQKSRKWRRADAVKVS